MACPSSGPRYTEALDAISNFQLWDAVFCTYAVPAGAEVVGLLFYGAISLGIFIKTGSVIIPFILILILGGTVLAQMMAVISSFAAIIVLLGAPIVITLLVIKLDR